MRLSFRIRIGAFLTLFFFSFTNLLPSGFSQTISQAPINGRPEKIPSSRFELSLPPELGQVTESYFPEDRSSSPVVFQIQTAHGDPEAQKRTRDILRTLTDSFGVRVIFAEGASEKIDPDLLHFFKNASLNLKMTDLVLQKGLYTGVDLFLMEGKPKIEVLGIENARLYRAAYEAFKKVLGNSKNSQSLLEEKETKLDRLASKVLSGDALSLLRVWQQFQKNRIPFLSYANQLIARAKKDLGLDFQSPFLQLDWPQLVRLALLQKFERDLEREKLETEKGQVEKLFGKTDVTESPRHHFERFLERAFPQGFRFDDYPNFTRWIAVQILRSELNAGALSDEIDKLWDFLKKADVKKESEREIFQQYEELSLLKKLSALELTRKEWERVKTARPAPAVQSALRFYRLSEHREQIFFETIQREMRSLGLTKSVLVTGGFHSEGMARLLKQNGFGYVVIAPRVGENISSDLYHKVMLGQNHLEITEVPQSFETKEIQEGPAMLKQEARILRSLFDEVSQKETSGSWAATSYTRSLNKWSRLRRAEGQTRAEVRTNKWKVDAALTGIPFVIIDRDVYPWHKRRERQEILSLHSLDFIREGILASLQRHSERISTMKEIRALGIGTGTGVDALVFMNQLFSNPSFQKLQLYLIDIDKKAIENTKKNLERWLQARDWQYQIETLEQGYKLDLGPRGQIFLVLVSAGREYEILDQAAGQKVEKLDWTFFHTPEIFPESEKEFKDKRVGFQVTDFLKIAKPLNGRLAKDGVAVMAALGQNKKYLAQTGLLPSLLGQGVLSEELNPRFTYEMSYPPPNLRQLVDALWPFDSHRVEEIQVDAKTYEVIQGEQFILIGNLLFVDQDEWRFNSYLDSYYPNQIIKIGNMPRHGFGDNEENAILKRSVLLLQAHPESIKGKNIVYISNRGILPALAAARLGAASIQIIPMKSKFEGRRDDQELIRENQVESVIRMQSLKRIDPVTVQGETVLMDLNRWMLEDPERFFTLPLKLLPSLKPFWYFLLGANFGRREKLQRLIEDISILGWQKVTSSEISRGFEGGFGSYGFQHQPQTGMEASSTSTTEQKSGRAEVRTEAELTVGKSYEVKSNRGMAFSRLHPFVLIEKTATGESKAHHLTFDKEKGLRTLDRQGETMPEAVQFTNPIDIYLSERNDIINVINKGEYPITILRFDPSPPRAEVRSYEERVEEVYQQMKSAAESKVTAHYGLDQDVFKQGGSASPAMKIYFNALVAINLMMAWEDEFRRLDKESNDLSNFIMEQQTAQGVGAREKARPTEHSIIKLLGLSTAKLDLESQWSEIRERLYAYIDTINNTAAELEKLKRGKPVSSTSDSLQDFMQLFHSFEQTSRLKHAYLLEFHDLSETVILELLMDELKKMIQANEKQGILQITPEVLQTRLRSKAKVPSYLLTLLIEKFNETDSQFSLLPAVTHFPSSYQITPRARAEVRIGGSKKPDIITDLQRQLRSTQIVILLEELRDHARHFDKILQDVSKRLQELRKRANGLSKRSLKSLGKATQKLGVEGRIELLEKMGLVNLRFKQAWEHDGLLKERARELIRLNLKHIDKNDLQSLAAIKEDLERRILEFKDLIRQRNSLFNKTEQEAQVFQKLLDDLEGKRKPRSEVRSAGRPSTPPHSPQSAARAEVRASRGERSGLIRVRRIKHHDLSLEPLRERLLFRHDPPIDAVISYDPHDDIGPLKRPQSVSPEEWEAGWKKDNEALWGGQALLQGLTQYFIQIIPPWEVGYSLSVNHIRIWTLKTSESGPRELVEIPANEKEKILEGLSGKEAKVTVDADAYWYIENGIPIFDTPLKKLNEQTQWLVEFLERYEILPESEVDLSDSTGDETHKRWVPNYVQESDLQALARHLEEVLNPMRPLHRVGPYRILHVIKSSKPRAAVYQATDSRTGQEAILKVFKPLGNEEDALRQRGHNNELTQLQFLKDRGATIQPVFYDAGHDGDRTWIAIELLEGVTLEDWMKGKSVDEKRDIFMRVLDAVEELHRQGVIHFDLKPGNIMVLPGNRIKILDFESSQKANEPLRSLGGTLPYAPTERGYSPLKEKGLLVTPASDIFSLGVILFELATGSPYLFPSLPGPFEGIFSYNVIYGRVSKEMIREKLPEEWKNLAEVIFKAVSFLPENRFQTVQEMRIALARAEVRREGMIREFIDKTASILPLISATVTLGILGREVQYLFLGAVPGLVSMYFLRFLQIRRNPETAPASMSRDFFVSFSYLVASFWPLQALQIAAFVTLAWMGRFLLSIFRNKKPGEAKARTKSAQTLSPRSVRWLLIGIPLLDWTVEFLTAGSKGEHFQPLGSYLAPLQVSGLFALVSTGWILSLAFPRKARKSLGWLLMIGGWFGSAFDALLHQGITDTIPLLNSEASASDFFILTGVGFVLANTFERVTQKFLPIKTSRAEGHVTRSESRAPQSSRPTDARAEVRSAGQPSTPPHSPQSAARAEVRSDKPSEHPSGLETSESGFLLKELEPGMNTKETILEILRDPEIQWRMPVFYLLYREKLKLPALSRLRGYGRLAIGLGVQDEYKVHIQEVHEKNDYNLGRSARELGFPDSARLQSVAKTLKIALKKGQTSVTRLNRQERLKQKRRDIIFIAKRLREKLDEREARYAQTHSENSTALDDFEEAAVDSLKAEGRPKLALIFRDFFGELNEALQANDLSKARRLFSEPFLEYLPRDNVDDFLDLWAKVPQDPELKRMMGVVLRRIQRHFGLSSRSEVHRAGPRAVLLSPGAVGARAEVRIEEKRSGQEEWAIQGTSGTTPAHTVEGRAALYSSKTAEEILYPIIGPEKAEEELERFNDLVSKVKKNIPNFFIKELQPDVLNYFNHIAETARQIFQEKSGQQNVTLQNPAASVIAMIQRDRELLLRKKAPESNIQGILTHGVFSGLLDLVRSQSLVLARLTTYANFHNPTLRERLEAGRMARKELKNADRTVHEFLEEYQRMIDAAKEDEKNSRLIQSAWKAATKKLEAELARVHHDIKAENRLRDRKKRRNRALERLELRRRGIEQYLEAQRLTLNEMHNASSGQTIEILSAISHSVDTDIRKVYLDSPKRRREVLRKMLGDSENHYRTRNFAGILYEDLLVARLFKARRTLTEAIYGMRQSGKTDGLALQEEWLRRISDLIDVVKEIIASLAASSEKAAEFHHLEFGDSLENIILVVPEELSIGTINKIWAKYGTRIRGIITSHATPITHWVVISQGLPDPPAIIFVSGEEAATLSKIRVGDPIILSTGENLVVVHPHSERRIKSIRDQFREELIHRMVLTRKEEPTPFGIKIKANITPGHADGLRENGADGIGLDRTEVWGPAMEILIERMIRRLTPEGIPPEIQEGFRAALIGEYSHLMSDDYLAGKEITVRTLDIQKDKNEKLVAALKETGFDFYRTKAGRQMLVQQIAALYVSYVSLPEPGREKPILQILFPMVRTKEDLDYLQGTILPEAIDLAITDLENSGMDEEAASNQIRQAREKKGIRMGVMIETVDALTHRQEILEHPLVDFFNVGTNDLIQEILSRFLSESLREETGVDIPVVVSRDVAQQTKLFSKFHPLLINALKEFVHTVALYNHRRHFHKEICFCGQIAGTPKFMPFLYDLQTQYRTPVSASMSMGGIALNKFVLRLLSVHTDGSLFDEPQLETTDQKAEELVNRLLRTSRTYRLEVEAPLSRMPGDQRSEVRSVGRPSTPPHSPQSAARAEVHRAELRAVLLSPGANRARAEVRSAVPGDLASLLKLIDAYRENPQSTFEGRDAVQVLADVVTTSQTSNRPPAARKLPTKEDYEKIFLAGRALFVSEENTKREIGSEQIKEIKREVDSAQHRLILDYQRNLEVQYMNPLLTLQNAGLSLAENKNRVRKILRAMEGDRQIILRRFKGAKEMFEGLPRETLQLGFPTFVWRKHNGKKFLIKLFYDPVTEEIHWNQFVKGWIPGQSQKLNQFYELTENDFFDLVVYQNPDPTDEELEAWIRRRLQNQSRAEVRSAGRPSTPPHSPQSAARAEVHRAELRAVLLSPGAVGARAEVRSEGNENLTYHRLIEQAFKKEILRAFLKNGGDLSKTARALGITRITLRSRIRRYGLPEEKTASLNEAEEILLSEFQEVIREPSKVKITPLAELEEKTGTPILRQAFQDLQGNISKVAKQLGLNRSTLKERLKRYKMYLRNINAGRIESAGIPRVIRAFSQATEEAMRDTRIDPIIRGYIGGPPSEKQIEAALQLLNDKRIVGMLPSEGKTLTVVLAAYLKVKSGNKVEIHDWNRLLSARDAQIAGAILTRLGIKVFAVLDHFPFQFDPFTERNRTFSHLKWFSENRSRSAAFQAQQKAFREADIVYGPYDEMIFLWMNDWFVLGEGKIHLTEKPEWILVEEADTPLLDEMNESLAFFKRSYFAEERKARAYKMIYDSAGRLKENEHYEVREGEIRWIEGRLRNVLLGLNLEFRPLLEDLEAGQRILENSNLADLLKAAIEVQRERYVKDEDYFILNKEIVIRDTNTGDLKHQRRWPRGIHTFLEIKEKLPIQTETLIEGVLTPLEFYKRIPHWSGVAGILDPASVSSLKEYYGVDITFFEPAHLSQRTDLPPRYFLTEEEKFEFITHLVRTVSRSGRPILIDTRTPKEAEELARRIRAMGFLKPDDRLRVITGRDEKRDALNWNRMGDASSITLAAQIASRGQEIKLEESLFEPARLEDFPDQIAGLFVLLTHQPSLVRIEEQMKARTARRGKPGSVLIVDHLQGNRFLEKYVPELLEIFLRENQFRPNHLIVPLLFKEARDRHREAWNKEQKRLRPLFEGLAEIQLRFIQAAQEARQKGQDVGKIKVDMIYQALASGDEDKFWFFYRAFQDEINALLATVPPSPGQARAEVRVSGTQIPLPELTPQAQEIVTAFKTRQYAGQYFWESDPQKTPHAFKAHNYLILELAEALKKSPGQLSVGDFTKQIEAFNWKSLSGPLYYFKKKGMSDSEAVQAVKRKFSIPDTYSSPSPHPRQPPWVEKSSDWGGVQRVFASFLWPEVEGLPASKEDFFRRLLVETQKGKMSNETFQELNLALHALVKEGNGPARETMKMLNRRLLYLKKELRQAMADPRKAEKLERALERAVEIWNPEGGAGFPRYVLRSLYHALKDVRVQIARQKRREIQYLRKEQRALEKTKTKPVFQEINREELFKALQPIFEKMKRELESRPGVHRRTIREFDRNARLFIDRIAGDKFEELKERYGFGSHQASRATFTSFQKLSLPHQEEVAEIINALTLSRPSEPRSEEQGRAELRSEPGLTKKRKVVVETNANHAFMGGWLRNRLSKIIDEEIIRNATLIHVDFHPDTEANMLEGFSEGNVVARILEQKLVERVWWVHPKSVQESKMDSLFFDRTATNLKRLPKTDKSVILSIDFDAFASKEEPLLTLEEIYRRIEEFIGQLKGKQYKVIGIFLAHSPFYVQGYIKEIDQRLREGLAGIYQLQDQGPEGELPTSGRAEVRMTEQENIALQIDTILKLRPEINQLMGQNISELKRNELEKVLLQIKGAIRAIRYPNAELKDLVYVQDSSKWRASDYISEKLVSVLVVIESNLFRIAHIEEAERAYQKLKEGFERFFSEAEKVAVILKRNKLDRIREYTQYSGPIDISSLKETRSEVRKGSTSLRVLVTDNVSDKGEAISRGLLRRYAPRNDELRTGDVGIVALLAPKRMRRELRKMGVAELKPDEAAEVTIQMVEARGDLRQIAQNFKRLARKVYDDYSQNHEEYNRSQAETDFDPNVIRSASERLLGTLDKIGSVQASLGFYLSSQAGSQESTLQPGAMLLKAIQQAKPELQITEVIYNKEGGSRMAPFFKSLKALPRPHPMDKAIIPRNNQAAVMVYAEGVPEVELNPIFKIVKAIIPGDENPLIADYVKLLQAVAVLHLTDLTIEDPSLLANPEALKLHLLKRLEFLELKDFIQIEKNGFAIRGSMARIALEIESRKLYVTAA